jgi:hypothetical protein
MFFAMGATLSFGREGAVDIHHVGKTMVAWSHGRMVAFTDFAASGRLGRGRPRTVSGVFVEIQGP